MKFFKSPTLIAILALSASVQAAPGRRSRELGATLDTPVPARAAPSPALEVAQIDRRIADLDNEEASAKKELSELGSNIAEARQHSLVRGRAFYRLTRAGMLPVGGGFDALVSHALKVERSRRALATDLGAEGTLRHRGADLSRTLERIARDRVALSTQKGAMETARAAQFDDQRRQVAFDRAFDNSQPPTGGSNDYIAVYGGSSGGASATEKNGGGSFAASKGRLLFPLAGRSEIHPTRRGGADGPGLEVKATLGSAVRSVFAGRVSFADRYGPYGRLVILDHGDHYYSVSGNLASIDVKVGDELSAGEKIGTVGDEGKGAMLYFEVRHGTETINPSPWLGI